MDKDNKTIKSTVPGKKEMRKQLADKISAAIPELQSELGDKKFHHRVKKAVKLLTEGMHKKEAADTMKKATAVKAKAPKTVVAKKVKAAKS